MSSGSYYEEEMSSGGHRRLTAFILWPFSPSKKSPLDPPSPWSWLGAYHHGAGWALTFVRKFLQFAVFLNRQAAVPIFGQLLLPIISSFASHAVLPLLRFVEEHTTLSDSNPDGAGWALTYSGRYPLACGASKFFAENRKKKFPELSAQLL